jgi:hypothetical protein
VRRVWHVRSCRPRCSAGWVSRGAICPSAATVVGRRCVKTQGGRRRVRSSPGRTCVRGKAGTVPGCVCGRARRAQRQLHGNDAYCTCMASGGIRACVLNLQQLLSYTCCCCRILPLGVILSTGRWMPPPPGPPFIIMTLLMRRPRPSTPKPSPSVGLIRLYVRSAAIAVDESIFH